MRRTPKPPLPSAKARFIAKHYGKQWRVYDVELASYPVERPEFGVLPTYATEAECAAKVSELNALV